MAGPRPGSHAYEVKLARLRKRLENTGEAADKEAKERANQILQGRLDARSGLHRSGLRKDESSGLHKSRLRKKEER
jgi:hypothetical protein